jgi:hypothetical protein
VSLSRQVLRMSRYPGHFAPCLPSMRIAVTVLGNLFIATWALLWAKTVDE